MKSIHEKESTFQAEGQTCIRGLRQERTYLVHRPKRRQYDCQDWRKVAQEEVGEVEKDKITRVL